MSSPTPALTMLPDPLKNEGDYDHRESDVGRPTTAEPLFPPSARIGLWKTVKTYRIASLFCILCATTALSDGFGVQMSGSIVALEGFTRQFGVLQPNGGYKVNPNYVAIWGSMKSVFAIVGSGLGSFPTDRFGRKWSILGVTIIMLGACTLEQLATTWTQWLGARMLDGISVGLAQSCLTVYISEIAPTEGRGALISLVNFFYNIGTFLASISLNIVSQDDPTHWRHAVLSQFACCGVAFIAALPLPESPRWLCQRGKEAKCRQVLSKLNNRVDDFDADLEYAKICHELRSAAATRALQGGGSYADVFRGTNLRRLIISILPWHWQVAIGIPIMSTYSSYFWGLIGLKNPFDGTVATNCVGLFMLFISLPLIERLGRRTLLVFFSPICIVSLICVGVTVKYDGPPAAMVFFACAWQVGISTSCGPTGYLYSAEVATTRLRAKTSGIAIMVIQALAAVYLYVAPIMLNAKGLGLANTVFVWVGTASVGYVAVWLLVPETKGRSFAELDELFDRKIPAWRFHKTITMEDRQREGLAQRGAGDL